MARRPVGRIQERSTFAALKRSAARAARGPIRVSFTMDPGAGSRPFPLVGYAISKQNGTAVVRNRLRRRLRSVVGDAAGTLVPGTYLIATSPAAAGLSYGDLTETVNEAMRAAAAKVPASAVSS
jgi:ribonuclease P protein component